MKLAKWRLADVVDFELLQGRVDAWKSAWINGVSARLEEEVFGSEGERRRVVFRELLGDVRNDDGVGLSVGTRVVSNLKLAAVLLFILMMLLGVGVVRGLLVESPSLNAVGGRGFNIWVFLAVTLGMQWLFYMVLAVGYVLWRRWTGGLGALTSLVSSLALKWGGTEAGLVRLSGEAGKAWRWRLTRVLQAGGIGYNVGLLVGLFGCLWFMQVGYFWETSLAQFGAESLRVVTDIVSFPVGGLPMAEAIELSKVGSEMPVAAPGEIAQSLTPRMKADLEWGTLLFVGLFFWGLLPRVCWWSMAWWGEQRSLAKMEFEEARDRRLWREVTQVRRDEVSSEPADGVVVLDLGGVAVGTPELRPYLLQRMRVNPESRYVLGVLDQGVERESLEAARSAALGVVFLVDGWNLSPKQMRVYHEKVRDAIGAKHMIRYLVVGSLAEMEQWSKFVDGLKDSESEVFLLE